MELGDFLFVPLINMVATLRGQTPKDVPAQTFQDRIALKEVRDCQELPREKVYKNVNSRNFDPHSRLSIR